MSGCYSDSKKSMVCKWSKHIALDQRVASIKFYKWTKIAECVLLDEQISLLGVESLSQLYANCTHLLCDGFMVMNLLKTTTQLSPGITSISLHHRSLKTMGELEKVGFERDNVTELELKGHTFV